MSAARGRFQSFFNEFVRKCFEIGRICQVGVEFDFPVLQFHILNGPKYSALKIRVGTHT